VALRNPDKWSPSLLTSLQPILRLLEDDKITEIEVNGFNVVFVKGQGIRGHQRVEQVGWRDLSDFTTACTRISDVIQRRINQERPRLDGRLPGGERVNIVIPPACELGSMTIRKFPAETMTIEKLLGYKSISEEMASIMRALVHLRKSTLVAGGTGSGKTSLLNALSRLVPDHERVVTVEDSRELQIQNQNWVALETVEPYKEGVPPVTIGDLVKNTLRQTPDRTIVGEVRGDEAFYLVRALSTGHGGGFGTIHANGGREALRQLQLLAQMAPVGGLDGMLVAEMVGDAIDAVLYASYDEDSGERRVTEILEVNKPGALILPNGRATYSVRQLVLWDEDRMEWVYKERPSPRLLRSIHRRKLDWPEASLVAPEPLLESVA